MFQVIVLQVQAKHKILQGLKILRQSSAFFFKFLGMLRGALGLRCLPNPFRCFPVELALSVLQKDTDKEEPNVDNARVTSLTGLSFIIREEWEVCGTVKVQVIRSTTS